MAAVPFPLSSSPGARVGEGDGRLINVYAEKIGNQVYFRRVPGSTTFATMNLSGSRGITDLNGTIYAAGTDAVTRVTAGGVASYGGALAGVDGVTWARNNKSPTPDLVAVRESGGAFTVTPSTVTAYPDADLPATVNSVAAMDGFLIFTVPDGRIFASDLNSTAINPLSFATAESKPDGLKRGISTGGTYYAMGTSTIQPYKNVGSSPFPMAPVPSVIPVGLLTTMAVAGFEEGWDHPPFFVAHDGTVRVLDGYDTKVVSTPDVERFIAASTVSTLTACVYTFRGNAIWSLSSSTGTWEFNVTTRQWHERKSLGQSRWTAQSSVKSNGVWRIADTQSGALLQISDTTQTEKGNALIATIESGALKEYPSRVAIPALFADFTKSTGASAVISWSHNGGETWTAGVTRSLATAEKYSVRVNRLGLQTHHGLRVRFVLSDAIEFSFMGASVPAPEKRAP